MTRDDQDLLAELARLNAVIPAFALRVISDEATPDEQIAFVRWLVEMAEALRQRADRGRALVIDGAVLRFGAAIAAGSPPMVTDA